MQPIANPFFQYFDLDGSPLENGSIYFGVANQNPELSPIAVFWDKFLTQPAAQPLKTINGYIVRDGVISQAYVNSNFSFTVRNKKGSLVINGRDSADSAFGVMFAALDAATAAVTVIGTSIQSQLWVGFTTTGSSGNYVLNPLPALTGYVSDRWKLNVKFHTGGNGSDNIDINGLGPKNIKQYDSFGAKIAPNIKAGMITDLVYDGTDWIILNPLLPSTPVGSFLLASAAIAPAGYLLCQDTVVNVSRTTYADLFTVIGTTWGTGDGSSTFGIPSFKTGHAMLQGYGTLGYGVETTGEIKAHTHTYVREFGALAQFAGGSQASGVTTNTGSTGGTHNLAAGKGVAIYIKF
jgi:microcystin-dependent protein